MPFSVSVPDDAPPGDYAAGIVAAMRVESAEGVVTERRLGARILLRVSGDLAPALSVTDVSITYDTPVNPLAADAADVTFTVTNEGNTRLAAEATVTVTGPFGIAPLRVGSGALSELLPGSSLEHTVRVADVRALVLLTADVTVDAAVVARPGDDPDALPSVAAQDGAATTVAVPWSALAVLVALLALVGWRVAARRRRRRQHRAEIDAAVAAALAEREEPALAETAAGRD